MHCFVRLPKIPVVELVIDLSPTRFRTLFMEVIKVLDIAYIPVLRTRETITSVEGQTDITNVP